MGYQFREKIESKCWRDLSDVLPVLQEIGDVRSMCAGKAILQDTPGNCRVKFENNTGKEVCMCIEKDTPDKTTLELMRVFNSSDEVLDTITECTKLLKDGTLSILGFDRDDFLDTISFLTAVLKKKFSDK